MYKTFYSTPLVAILLLTFVNTKAQTSPLKSTKEVSVTSAKSTVGVSVSPAHFHLEMKQGETETYSITVNNDTKSVKSFNVRMYDFNMNGKGKSSFLPSGEGEYSLSQWVNITPTFVELQPGEKKKIDFAVAIPYTEQGKKAAWSIIMIEQQEARTQLNPTNKSENTVALGVIPTFAFGVFVYQNPPNVDNNNVEFIDFQLKDDQEAPSIVIEAENKGDGIAYCTSYIDLTNINTGDQQRLTVKKFTILPGLIRDFDFPMPKELPKGEYIAVGVLDFENSEEIQAAKMEFTLK